MMESEFREVGVDDERLVLIDVVHIDIFVAGLIHVWC